jgi:hypothetical protein
MVSCDEELSRFVNSGDIITFQTTPGSTLNLVNVYRDDDNKWVELDPNLPHAVDLQFWGERVLRYFRSRGYLKRSKGDPTRVLMQYRPDVTNKDYAEWTDAWGGLNVPPFKGNSLIRVNGPGNVFRTAADPMVLTHEFAHSLLADQLGGIPAKDSEPYSIHEGIGDCLAMTAMRAYMREVGDDPQNNALPPGYLALGEEAPFHLWAGNYVSSVFASYGLPNLAKPNHSWGPDQNDNGAIQHYAYWSGARAIGLGDQPQELNSTLVGGVCKLLVTGGYQPVLGSSLHATYGTGKSALGQGAQFNDTDAGYDRLERLLLYTLTEQKGVAASFYDLIDILGANAGSLAQTEWGLAAGSTEERVRGSFAEYGFGRKEEQEPNDSLHIYSGGTFVAGAIPNLVAVGTNDAHPISGTLCDDDQDYLPLNERVKPGDVVHFEFSDTTSKIEVRFYAEKPCPMPDPNTQLDGCALDAEVYPPTTPNGLVPQGFPVQTKDDFVVPELGNLGLPTGSPYRLFAALRINEGDCTTSYTLKVSYKRLKEIYP